jgi:hypothetical protein
MGRNSLGNSASIALAPREGAERAVLNCVGGPACYGGLVLVTEGAPQQDGRSILGRGVDRLPASPRHIPYSSAEKVERQPAGSRSDARENRVENPRELVSP